MDPRIHEDDGMLIAPHQTQGHWPARFEQPGIEQAARNTSTSSLKNAGVKKPLTMSGS
ncbi:hypothetical protein [Massilia glaciei]|uniref:hypothetical protein n=1 Tax=Massilia glaciei TaxID=1524097 RepID=UPI0015E800FA|nr:hypothetical protein [Massilia glaciei]